MGQYDNQYTIKEILDSIAKKYRFTNQMNKETVLASWHEIAGPMVAKYTKKIDIVDGRLILEISDPSVKNELQYLRENLIDAVNKYMGKVVIEEVVIK
ncbi:MAG: DUF721 domain-containing protein [Bacteroidales bacterium]|nr:DUF721 domain-containing protein [Bacteroidales bacterium]